VSANATTPSAPAATQPPAATSAASSETASTSAATSSAPSGGAAAAYTVATASVPGVGTVLVNGTGMTLYILTSEAGGKLTCTDASGCTKVWPDTELPAGVTTAVAGAGIQSSLLGTVTSPDGHLYPTYHGYPLYTFTGDQGPGTAAGQGINSFGGTWETMGANGTPVAK
jgi:predicted lipoprotein with Yx(FWY)xxD motif